jgi:hypothetical protein
MAHAAWSYTATRWHSMSGGAAEIGNTRLIL